MLPEIETVDDYRKIYRDPESWLPAMRVICQRHDLDGALLTFAPPGTHVVFQAGPDRYIKLYTPLWPHDSATERLVLQRLSGRSDLPIPRLVAQGEIEGWPYVIMTAVQGVPLYAVWASLDNSQRAHIAEQCGAFMSSLHETPLDGLEAIAVDWPAFVQDQIRSRRENLPQSGLDDEWVGSVLRFLADAPPPFEPGFHPVLLSADVTDEHVLVSPRGEQWEFTGFIDFGDAMLGHPNYDLVAPGCCITRDAPDLLHAMMRGYGLGGTDDSLADQLMTYTLLHRYMDLPDLLGLFGNERPASFEELKQRLWSFGEPGPEAGRRSSGPAGTPDVARS